MAAITVTTMLGAYPSSPATAGWVALTKTSATAGPDTFAVAKGDVILVQNTHATNTITVTLASVADERGRTGDAVLASVAAGAIVAFGPLDDTSGWKQTNGTVQVTVSGTGTGAIMVLRKP